MGRFVAARWAGSGTEEDPYLPDVGGEPFRACVDLRPWRDACFVWLHDTDAAPAGTLDFGGTGDWGIPRKTRRWIRNNLDADLDGRTLREVLPKVVFRAQPGLRPSKRLKKWIIRLGPERFEQDVVSGGATYTEDFDQSDSTTLGPDLTWIEVSGDWMTENNKAISDGADGTHRYAAPDISGLSEDYIVEADLEADGGNARIGVAARLSLDGGVDNNYRFYYQPGRIRLSKHVDDVFTVLGDDTSWPSSGFSPAKTFTLEVDGSNITCSVDGTEEFSVTDSSVTGAGYAALYTVRLYNSQIYTADNFRLEEILSSTAVGTTVEMQWDVRDTVSNEAELQWALRAAVAEEVDLRWGIRSLAQRNVVIDWAVRELLSNETDLRWDTESDLANAWIETFPPDWTYLPHGSFDLDWIVTPSQGFRTNSSRLYVTAGHGVPSFAWLDPTPHPTDDDHYAEVEVYEAFWADEDRVGVVVRGSDAGNGFTGYTFAWEGAWGGRAWHLRRWEDGEIVNNIASSDRVEEDLTNGTVIRLEVKGDQLIPKVDGASPFSQSSYTDTTLTAGSPGIYGQSGGQFDNFVGGNFTFVATAMGLQWAVRQAVADAVEMQWALRSVVADSVAAQWSLRAALANELDLGWGTRATLADTANLDWSVRSSLADTANLDWSVRSSLADTANLDWSVRSSLADEIVARWALRVGVSEELDLSWDLRASLAGELDLGWAMRSLLSDEVDIDWDLRSALADELGLDWAVRSSLADEVAARWDLRASLAGALDLDWDVRATATDEVATRWHVRDLAGADVGLEWITRAVAGSTLDARWDVRYLAAKAVAAEWALRQTAGDAVGLSWAVKALAGAPIDLRWDIYDRLVAAVQLALQWGVREEVAFDVGLQWSLLTTATSALETVWDVRSAVPGSLEARWATRTLVATEEELQWAVRTLQAVDTSLEWSLHQNVGGETSLVWEILQLAATGDTVQLLWDVRQHAADEVEPRWSIRDLVGSASDLDWSVRQRASDEVESLWSIRDLVEGAADLQWDVRHLFSDEVAARWNTRDLVENTTDLQWSLRQSVADEVEARWGVRVPISDELAMQWVVHGGVGRDLDARWSVQAAVGRALLAQWGIRTSVYDEVEVDWALLQQVAADPVDIQWAVRGPVVTDLSLVWSVHSVSKIEGVIARVRQPLGQISVRRSPTGPLVARQPDDGLVVRDATAAPQEATGTVSDDDLEVRQPPAEPFPVKSHVE